MNKIYGKSCPYCKTELHQYDDVIVCDKCNMPHHKDCWIENNDCTTFGCLGTIDVPRQDTVDESVLELTIEDFEMIRCGICGGLNPNTNSYCEKCGSRLNDFHVQQKEFTDFIAQDTDDNCTAYYTKIFEDFARDANPLTWNWSAFLFATYWLIYRKMYVCGVCFLILILLLMKLGITAFLILNVILHIMIGMLGNYIYYKKMMNLHGSAKAFSKQFEVNITAAICAFVFIGIIFVSNLQSW